MSGHAEAPTSDLVDNVIEYSSSFVGILFFACIFFLVPFGYVREYTSEKQNETTSSHGSH